MSTTETAEPRQGALDRTLAVIERVGNKVPHPALLFLALCIGVILLSQVMAWVGVSATYDVVKPPSQSVDVLDLGGSLPGETLPAEPPKAGDYEVVTETVAIEGLLTAEGIRFLFTSFVPNFMGFTAMGIILIVMIGVGVAERSGLIAALIRRLVASAPASTLTYIIVFLGILSSIASDAGYLVLIPLGAAAFASVGRHPLAGMAAAFAGVAGGFGVNLLVTPTDAVLTEITNESIQLVDPTGSIDLTANLWFGIASTVLLTVLLGWVTGRTVERRLGTYDPSVAPDPSGQIQAADDAPDVDPEAERRGLRAAGVWFLGAVLLVTALTAPPGAPLRDPETGGIIGTSPFMNSLIVIIALLFLAAGVGYGRGAGSLHGSTSIIDAITKSWAGLAGLLLLFLLIAQFIAYFNYSKMPQVAAVKLGDLIERVDLATGWLLLIAILITLVVGIILPQAIAKWALLAPIFIPVFLRLGVEPEAILALYRVGDSPMNIVTPIMAYFPLIVVFAARYDRRAGIGTVIALMLPYFVALTVVWSAFFLLWYALGLPWGI
ncbi:MAG: SLC13 family permease [Candidatus Nanopelagicales bacterium]|jgi:aminobenzoyl-glutamate transport protein|nr:SLC13 family permease [Candidatus Nanopelagicales bacterium]